MPDPRPRVLLLRRAAVEDAYLAALQEAGYAASCRPVLAFQFIQQETLTHALTDATLYDGLILTSLRGVQAVERVIASLPAWPGGWRERPVFAVGPRTAEAVRAVGLQPYSVDAGTARVLARQIRDYYAANEQDRPLLFLSSTRRRDELPDRLRAGKVQFEEIHIYETHIQPPSDDAGVEADAVVFFSPSGVEAVLEGEWDAEVLGRLIAIGPTTAEALEAAGLPPDAVAPTPTPEGVIAALRTAL